MAKRQQAAVAPAPIPAWWDNCKHAASAFAAIEAAGHKVHPRRPYDGFAGLVGIVYKDTTLKRPGEYTDLDLYNLTELTDFAQLGREEFVRARKLAEYKRLARTFTVAMQDGTSPTFDGINELHRELLRRFKENGQRATQISVKNPFTGEAFTPLRVIYGIWEWGGEEQEMVCLRPADESIVKLPSCWLQTL